MASDRTLRCPDCGMTFNTVNMMTKHRDKFCVGRTTRLTMTSDDYSSDEETVGELKKMKAWHRRQRNLMDTKEKLLLQEAKQKEREERKKKAQVKKVLEGKQRKPSPKRDLWELNAEYDALQDTEEKLRTYIDGVEHIMRDAERQAVLSRESSVSLPPMISDDNDETSPRWQREHQAHLRSLAENHGRQLRDLQGKNRDLELQKEEIRRRLEELGRQDLKSSDSTIERMIGALKDQERKNQKTLEDLKRQLLAIHQKPPSQKKIISIPYHTGSLVSEISAMRLAYLQSGGNDPVVLAQMHDMQAEAQMLEDIAKSKVKKKKKPKENDNGFNAQVMMLELENQRLQEEILYQQNKRKRQQELDYEESMRRMRELQEDLARLRKELKQKPEEKPSAELAPMFPMPYSGSGFLVFFDFITGLEQGAKILRLITAQWEKENELGDPTTFPVTYCNSSGHPQYGGFASATVATRQQVPNAKPEPTTAVVVEVQLSNQPHDSRSLISRCWGKLPLFDEQIRVLTGRWKSPLRVTPVRPDISFDALGSVPQLGTAEIYYRVVDWRDAPREGSLPVSVGNAQHYNFAPMPYETGYGGGMTYQGGAGGYMGGGGPYYGGGGGQPYAGGGQVGPYTGGGQPYMGGGVPPQPTSPPPREELQLPLDVTPRPTYHSPRKHYSAKKTLRTSTRGQYTQPIVALPPKPVPMDVGNVLGLQVDRVRHAPGGEGKVRLTVYHQYSGQPAKTNETAITCTTTAVQSNYKYGYHVFGQQEALFNDVNFQTDMIIVARFYLRQRMKTDNIPDDLAAEVPLLDEEKLIAWTVMPLVQVYGGFNRVHTGTHKLRMYYPPVPVIKDIPLMPHQYPKEWVKYGKCTARIHIFTGKPPGTLTPSTVASDLEEDVPEDAWIPCEREKPPAEPFNSGDGFDLYIDGARHLPDCVTISRVAGRIFDKKYDKIGKDITTMVSLDSDIFNPVYNFRQEFRDLAIPPTATLLIKVYSIDRFTKRLTVVGFASLNIFVVSGTEKQPPADTGAVQVSLNEGTHQIRLHHLGPDANKPLSNQTLKQTQLPVPCASVLVRLKKATIGPNGRPLEADRVPESDWPRFGLLVPRPLYADGVYLSMECEPSRGEKQMFHTQIRRKMVRQRDVISLIGDGRERKLRTDKNISQWIGAQLTRLMDVPPLDLDMNLVCRYQPHHGIRVSVDGALNLPWSKFTHASICLNPPASFYYGTEQAAYDRLKFTEELDFGSNFKAPVWHDGWHWYPNRHFHKYLTLIIHLQEIGVTVHADRYKYGLMDQAWTAVQIFDKHYAITDTFQLPLYEGNPTPDILNALSRQTVKEALNQSVVKPAENSSVFIRIADARRHEELPQPLINANTEYIPPHKLGEYTSEVPSKPLKTLIPKGRAEREFAASLASKFRSLVYKLASEEDELNTK
ncbi:uncharacterized protein [Ptychodera flava]|uniref:uncharacterized protein isoform X2 n=1 Tax=Ptychodera flava TaxID=63121 RepID=UPI00396A5F09